MKAARQFCAAGYRHRFGWFAAHPCIDAAVVAGGKHVSGPHEAFVAADPFQGDVRVLITGAHGFERTVTFPLDENPALIAERVRESLEE